MADLTLFSAQGADGDGTAVAWAGGRGMVIADGTFGSGTFTLQILMSDGTSWAAVDATNGILTADGVFIFELGPCQIRGSLAGSTSPTLSAIARRYSA